MKAQPKLTNSINIRRDTQDDHQPGWDLHHPYIETFWLPILGPSSTALLRYIGRHVTDTNYVTWTPTELSQSLGLGTYRGCNSPLIRTIHRLARYGLAQLDEDTPQALNLTIAATIPIVASRHQSDWPEPLRILHAQAIARHHINQAVPPRRVAS